MVRKSSQGWRTIGDRKIYARSRWEANYARYLEWLKIKGFIKAWEHEPKTFWFEKIKRGTRSYLPDFQVFKEADKWQWVEVKGYMDARSKTKLARMKKYYPKEKIIVVDGKWFRANNAKLKNIVPGWET